MTSTPRDEAQLFAALTRFLHGTAQAGAAELESFGLTPAQYQMLAQVRARPGVAQWELADAFGVTKGNVSQLVKKLEVAGLVDRVRNQGTDELALTSAGMALLDRVVPAHDDFMRRTFSSLSAEEIEVLFGLVDRLSRS